MEDLLPHFLPGARLQRRRTPTRTRPGVGCDNQLNSGSSPSVRAKSNATPVVVVRAGQTETGAAAGRSDTSLSASTVTCTGGSLKLVGALGEPVTVVICVSAAGGAATVTPPTTSSVPVEASDG